MAQSAVNAGARLLWALLLTVLIEGALTVLITRDRRKLRHNFLCNVITNPILNITAMLLHVLAGLPGYYLCLFIGEPLVVLAEWRLYILFGEKSSKKAFLLSLLTNALSLLAGLLINKLDVI